jgi:3-deoxy-manno-octulosonate cytidylyltransferase (CMP-KDO synthetase)
MKIIAVIPARYASTRLPAKLMQDLGGKPVITRTYEAAVGTGLFSEVIVVTDSVLIYEEIKSRGGNVQMSIKEHESGSDRIAEAIQDMEVDVVINVQGDEPFIDSASLKLLIDVFRNDFEEKIDLASLMREIASEEEIHNPNNVKVVVDYHNFALYFSRSVIPYPRATEVGVKYYQHIGIYAFRKKALMDFYQLPIAPLEANEKLEQLRYLYNGKRIKMVETTHVGIGIDTQEDLDRARGMI